MDAPLGNNLSCKLNLDIACGKNKKPGFKGVDIWDGADIVADLEKFPWPFDDDSVDEVFCSHYIEHTPDLMSFANELYRIMKVGAKAEIIAPYYSSIRAWQDPTHLRAISEATFLYFNKEWRVINRLDHYPIHVDFDFEYRLLIDPQWLDKDVEELQFAIRHYINVVSDIHVILTKKSSNDEVSSLLKQASNCWENSDFNNAIIFCNKLLEIENNLEAFLMIGEYEMKNEKFAAAIVNFTKALEINTESFEAHAGLVRAYVASGQLGNAKKHLEDLQKHDVDSASQLEIYLEC